MKYKPMTIYCPQCHVKVGTYDGRSSMDVITRCRACRKRVIYHVADGWTEIKDAPQRNCSSGMTF